MSDFLHLNGQLLAYDDARIAPADAGLLHGAGLFETMRAKNGKIFRLRNHLQRLATSAHALNIPFALSESQLAEITTDLLDANGLLDARLRLTLTRGDLHEATAENPTPPVTLLLTAAEFQPYPAALYEKGMTVILSRFKQNPESPLTGHKTTSYFDRLLALREAQELKAGEALWFTPHTNLLAEGSISNIFLVTNDGILATPPLAIPDQTNQRLCLPGITRQLVLELATAANLLPHERPLTINDLLTAKEVFLTNAIMGLMPVIHIEKHTVADGQPGPLTQQLRTAYDQALAGETR
ncbi:MAG TPA: aminotransferase class IV [Phycisphaerae bacterium]|nr:aminotransferase class IV [Phycisphaerae bacterium]